MSPSHRRAEGNVGVQMVVEVEAAKLGHYNTPLPRVTAHLFPASAPPFPLVLLPVPRLPLTDSSLPLLLVSKYAA